MTPRGYLAGAARKRRERKAAEAEFAAKLRGAMVTPADLMADKLRQEDFEKMRRARHARR